jgi:hypothetical protein
VLRKKPSSQLRQTVETVHLMHPTMTEEQFTAMIVLLSKKPGLGGHAVPFKYLFVLGSQLVHTLNDEHVVQV